MIKEVNLKDCLKTDKSENNDDNDMEASVINSGNKNIKTQESTPEKET